MNIEKLAEVLKNYPKFRTKQAEDAIYKNLINDWSDAKGLPKDIKEVLKKEVFLNIKAKDFSSQDATSKRALIYLEDEQNIESVLMNHSDGRKTVCVSSQVGCPLACSFCATGKLGFKRNLTTDEIVEQVLYFARKLKDSNERVSNIVFMGMGEPFLNFDNVLNAIKILNEKLGIGYRKISISTSGIVPGIKKIAKEDMQVNLALSLHAPNNHLRNELMPINRQYKLEEVMSAVGQYIDTTNRRVMVEYIMIEDLNDTEDNARELVKLLKKYLKRLFFVNLIPCNPTGRYTASKDKSIKRFKKILEDEKIEVIQRYKFGRDIQGACGQLSANLREK